MGVQEPTLVVFNGFFSEFLTPFTLGAYNFLISNPFFMIVYVLDAPKGVVQVLFGHHKKWSPPLGSSLPYVLKCSVIRQFIHSV